MNGKQNLYNQVGHALTCPSGGHEIPNGLNYVWLCFVFSVNFGETPSKPKLWSDSEYRDAAPTAVLVVGLLLEGGVFVAHALGEGQPEGRVVLAGVGGELGLGQGLGVLAGAPGQGGGDLVPLIMKIVIIMK